MTKKIETRQVLYWFLARVSQVLMALIMTLIVIIMINDIKIRIMERPITIDWDTICGNEETVEEQFQSYIDSLPMPDMSDVPRVQEQPVVIQGDIVKPMVQADEEEVLLLAQLMHAEEGVLRRDLSSEDAKMAHMLCGSVVINRRNMNYRGAKTIKDVIYTKGQYACIENLNQKVPDETIEWARELLENGPIGPENMIYQAEFEQGSETVAHIGNQYFCCK